MYAWRARIGLIKPTHRGKSFHFWYKRAPEGVEIVPTFVGFRRSDRQTFENAFERIEQIADDLKAVGCHSLTGGGVYGIMPEPLWQGATTPLPRPRKIDGGIFLSDCQIIPTLLSPL